MKFTFSTWCISRYFFRAIYIQFDFTGRRVKVEFINGFCIYSDVTWWSISFYAFRFAFLIEDNVTWRRIKLECVCWAVAELSCTGWCIDLDGCGSNVIEWNICWRSVVVEFIEFYSLRKTDLEFLFSISQIEVLTWFTVTDMKSFSVKPCMYFLWVLELNIACFSNWYSLLAGFHGQQMLLNK